jgi:hypothetical protein
MAVTTHVFPNLDQNLGSKLMNITSSGDTLGCLLIASGSITWGSGPQAYNSVADFLANSTGGGTLTEASGGGYARKNLTSVSLSTSGSTTTLTCANVAWTSASFSVYYACFFDNTPSSDATRQLICYWDFGGVQTVVSSTFTLQISGSGLVTWVAS